MMLKLIKLKQEMRDEVSGNKVKQELHHKISRPTRCWKNRVRDSSTSFSFSLVHSRVYNRLHGRMLFVVLISYLIDYDFVFNGNFPGPLKLRIYGLGLNTFTSCLMNVSMKMQTNYIAHHW